MIDQRLVTIKATYLNQRYYNALTNWGIFGFKYAGDKITVVGMLVGVSEGEEVELTGYWENNLQYGRELKLESFRVTLPTTAKGVEGYLGSGLIKGIGKATAKAIVQTFGAEALKIIAEDPDRLREVPKIGKKKIQQIVDSYTEKRHLQDLIVFLQEYDIGVGQAVRIDKALGASALGIIRNNPYVLAEKVRGIGFRTADHIALSLGLPADDPQRVIAALQAVIHESGNDGHLYMPASQLIETTAQMVDLPSDMVVEQVRIAIEAGKLVVDPEDLDEAGHVAPSTPIYTKYFYDLECSSAELLSSLQNGPFEPWLSAPDEALKALQEKLHITLASQQYQAVLTATRAKMMVITGGPGTGKTTIIRSIVKLADSAKLKTFLTAPTGRAAKRMEETTGKQSKTIHRLLEYNVQLHDFSHNDENPLDCDLLIIDEMSMVDMALLYHLLLAIPATCQIIFVGDIDQLPSVGPGNVLRDIINSQLLPVVKLTEVFRQAQTSMIVRNAHRINQGDTPLWPENGQESDFYLVERQDAAAAQQAIVELISKRIPAKFGFDPIDEIQLLTPMRRGELGVQALNDVLQKKLNPRAKGGGYAVGDKVMQLRNNYEKDVFNGDVGRIVRIGSGEKASIDVDYDGHVVTYPTETLDEITLAYATTIHKSQGSEYPAVVIVMHGQHAIMLQRNLLYTAITRGKKLVMIVGTKRAVGLAIRNDKAPQRKTKLAWRCAKFTKKSGA